MSHDVIIGHVILHDTDLCSHAGDVCSTLSIMLWELQCWDWGVSDLFVLQKH